MRNLPKRAREFRSTEPARAECAVASGIPAAALTQIMQSRAGLLRRQITNVGQFELFIVVGLVHQENPGGEDCELDQAREQPGEAPSAGEYHADEQRAPYNPKNKHSCSGENRLKRMEANKTVALVRLNHQKNDSGDEPEEITQRPGKVIGHARACRLGLGR